MSSNLELDGLDAVFFESYDGESDSSEENEDELEKVVEAEGIGIEGLTMIDEDIEVKLGISEDQARTNYEEAGK